ncbi:MAG: 1,4-dihydroxy-6-naphthoate synthase [Desulfobulbaceae bacterium]|nr:1,4-dihydroxy-6-naphthoate synthase [Desulfobulbaceae bacterium]
MNPEQKKLSIGYSPCPNDTFIFYALTHGHVPLSGVSFKEPVLADVEQLNRWALETKLDVTKLSFHALGYTLDQYVMLSAGAALGRGCGPLLIAREKGFFPRRQSRIAIPGTHTTAALLLKLYAPLVTETVVLRFDRIMEAVQNGDVDGGVIIHEGRFTYQEKGLHCVRDLGNWWEEETGYPIPLGCIVARASLDSSLLLEIDQGIRESLRWIRRHPEQGREYIRAHAQELDSRVIGNHIDLYVNDFSEQLGDEGIQAVQELLRRGRESGVFPMEGQLQWIH